ncbi:hypothetical protein LINGRAHAP2_LOCUS2386, partial [Linum grandiflorum]
STFASSFILFPLLFSFSPKKRAFVSELSHKILTSLTSYYSHGKACKKLSGKVIGIGSNSAVASLSAQSPYDAVVD